MNAKKFSDAMSELDTKYVDEALNHKKKAKRPGWIKWGAMAACLCLVVYAGIRLIPTDSPPDESSELPPLNAQFESGDMGFEGLMLFDISGCRRHSSSPERRHYQHGVQESGGYCAALAQYRA